MNRFFIDYNQLKTLDKDLIRLYHEEAGKRMADLKEIESLITDKAYRLFSIYYAVEIAVVGYVLTQIDVNSTLAVSNIRNRTYTNCEVYLIDYGYGNFKEKIHFME